MSKALFGALAMAVLVTIDWVEPASLLFLGTGLAGLAGFVYLRSAMRRLGSHWDFDED